MSHDTHRVAILVHDGVGPLDVVGPAEVLGEANLPGADYRISPVSTTGADVASSIGVRITDVRDGTGAHGAGGGLVIAPPLGRLLVGADSSPASSIGRGSSGYLAASIRACATAINAEPPNSPRWERRRRGQQPRQIAGAATRSSGTRVVPGDVLGSGTRSSPAPITYRCRHQESRKPVPVR
ncbi:type 1 glutamine amidotransferase family protein [Streptomyces dangxiongensis]|uniref:hypothetical protein n=1 Tax=Streptomyces dangxiongensis TaxID=1442032 RepID=UPI002695E141